MAGLVLGPSIGEAMTSRANVDPSPRHARNNAASRHDNLVGESASTTGQFLLIMVCTEKWPVNINVWSDIRKNIYLLGKVYPPLVGHSGSDLSGHPVGKLFLSSF